MQLAASGPVTGPAPALRVDQALTINQAATTTGWSPRMLRYIEQLGLVEAPRSAGGYRLYGPAQLQRLRTLRELLERSGLELGDVGLALRLRREPELATELATWFEAAPARPAVGRSTAPEAALSTPSEPLTDADWLRFEQDKHQQLLRG